MNRLVFAVAFLAPAVCAAQVPASALPELVTDRPGFGESSAVVARGTLQIESGVSLEDSRAAHRTDAAGQLLGRIGVAPRVELRVGVDGSDTEIGGKVKLADTARAGVDVAVIPYVSLPAEDAGGRAHDPGFKVAASADLPRGFGLSGTFNAADARGDTRRAWQRELSVSLGHALSSRLAAYGEADGTFAGRRCACSIDGGVTTAVGRNAQVDVEAGRGLHGPAQKWFVGAGLVFRTPLRARRR